MIKRGLVLLTIGACGSSGHGSLPDAPSGSGTPLGGVTAISAGHDFACALLTDGSVRCWGENDFDELGSAVNDSSLHCASVHCSRPVVVAGVTATAIAAGLGGACALHADHTVTCWGDDTNGQLGDGTTMTTPEPPVAVTGLANVAAISAGAQTMCALQTSGAVLCWGTNVFGQLGNSSTNPSSTPVAPTGLAAATQISAGNGRTCAVTSGTALCWGDNNLGELGVGSTGNNSTMPVAVTGLSGVTAVSAGGFITCALLANHTVTCWGNDAEGELGTGSTSATPVAMPGASVTGLSGVTAISAAREGGNFACALAGGAVECWGQNAAGELGNGSAADSPVPVMVGGLTGVTAIAAGDSYACALLGNGNVECWGSNNDGQLGNGTTTDSSTPVLVTVP